MICAETEGYQVLWGTLKRAEVETSGVLLRKVYIKSKSPNFRTGPRVNTGRFSESCGPSFKDGENNPDSKTSHVRKRNLVYFSPKTFIFLLNYSL